MKGVEVLISNGEVETYIDDDISEHYQFITNGILQIWASVRIAGGRRENLVANYAKGQWLNSKIVQEK